LGLARRALDAANTIGRKAAMANKKNRKSARQATADAAESMTKAAVSAGIRGMQMAAAIASGAVRGAARAGREAGGTTGHTVADTAESALEAVDSTPSTTRPKADTPSPGGTVASARRRVAPRRPTNTGKGRRRRRAA
jgi:hypothetical protein